LILSVHSTCYKDNVIWRLLHFLKKLTPTVDVHSSYIYIYIYIYIHAHTRAHTRARTHAHTPILWMPTTRRLPLVNHRH